VLIFSTFAVIGFCSGTRVAAGSKKITRPGTRREPGYPWQPYSGGYATWPFLFCSFPWWNFFLGTKVPWTICSLDCLLYGVGHSFHGNLRITLSCSW